MADTYQQSSVPGGRLTPYRTPFGKDYLPGYTGHIPYKKEIYGCTIGDINKIVSGKPTNKVSNFDVDEYRGAMHEQYATLPTTGQSIMLNTGIQAPPPYGQRTMYSNPPLKDVDGLKLQYTNISNKGENWIGGPISNATAQQLPGYQGYIPSIKAENLYGKTYGKTTAISINKEYPKDPGVGKPPLGSGVDRYKTQNRDDYNKSNFRRFVNATAEPADIIDQVDALNLQDEEFQGIQIGKPNIYQTIQAVGYQGFKSSYRPPIVTTYHRKQPQFNANAMKPRLPPSASGTILPTEQSNYQTLQETSSKEELPNGFQRAFSASKTRLTDSGSVTEMKTVPVVGYTGHRMGYKSQGFFGKNFRDCTIQSRNIQKAFEGKNNHNSGSSFSQLATF